MPSPLRPKPRVSPSQHALTAQPISTLPRPDLRLGTPQACAHSPSFSCRRCELGNIVPCEVANHDAISGFRAASPWKLAWHVLAHHTTRNPDRLLLTLFTHARPHIPMPSIGLLVLFVSFTLPIRSSTLSSVYGSCVDPGFT